MKSSPTSAVNLVHNRVAGRILTTLLFAALSVTGCGGGGTGTSGGETSAGSAAPSTQIFNDTTPVNWSDPDTWGGSLPQANEDVLIPAGRHILLDTNVDVATLTIEGRLGCANTDIDLKARWIMVHGQMVCGTDTNPFRNRLRITLKGQNKAENVMNMGTKTLSAMEGGLISLHGETRTSWLMLNKTANPGDSSITLEYAPNWRQGDSIVIASTADDMNQAEVVQIKKVNGTVVTLKSPLRYRHYGVSQSFSNGKRNWQLDTRAEVGLLSRNIVIQGDQSSDSNGFGGHVMIMRNGVALFSGVEMNRMGQKGILGRYPFHWHLAENVAGQYIRNSSIRNSFNRCITVHGTHNARVEDNVCYDHIGHGYFLEDGVETGNVFDHNLGLLTRRPETELAIIESDIQEGEAARGPSTFWISNGDNTFTNNAAAGSDGLGYWYDTELTASGPSARNKKYRNVNPRQSKFGVFSDNRVHSSDMAFSTCSNSAGPIGYEPPTRANYQNLTVFSSGNGAVWPCHGNQIFTNMVVSDTGHRMHAAFVAPRPVTVKNSLFVANTQVSPGDARQRTAFGIYDFGVDIRDVHFVGYNNEHGGSYLFGAREADVRFTSNLVSGLTFSDSYLYYDMRHPVSEQRPSRWGAVVHDIDGSFGLGPGTALVADHPLMVDNTCTDNYGTGKLCQNRYGRVKFEFGTRNLPPMTHSRSDGPTVTATPLKERKQYQSVVSVNHNRYHYQYAFDPAVIRNRSLLATLEFLHDLDTVVLEFTNLPASARVATNTYRVVGSVAELKTGSGRLVAYENGSVFIRMQTSGANWQASDRVKVSW